MIQFAYNSLSFYWSSGVAFAIGLGVKGAFLLFVSLFSQRVDSHSFETLRELLSATQLITTQRLHPPYVHNCFSPFLMRTIEDRGLSPETIYIIQPDRIRTLTVCCLEWSRKGTRESELSA